MRKKRRELMMPAKFADITEEGTEHGGSGWPAGMIAAGVLFCAGGAVCWVLNRFFNVGSKKAMNIAAGVLCGTGLAFLCIGWAGFRRSPTGTMNEVSSTGTMNEVSSTGTMNYIRSELSNSFHSSRCSDVECCDIRSTTI